MLNISLLLNITLLHIISLICKQVLQENISKQKIQVLFTFVLWLTKFFTTLIMNPKLNSSKASSAKSSIKFPVVARLNWIRRHFKCV